MREQFMKNKPFMHDGIIWPPFPGLYPDTDRKLQDRQDMECRDSDIFLCSFPKAGTHWTHEILSMLISQSTEYNTCSEADNFLEILPDVGVLNSKPSRRFLLTHMPYRYLPTQLKNGKGKIVYVQRNPKDIYVSMYNHFKGKMIPDDFPWSEFFDTMVLGDKTMMGGWFKYTKEWEKIFHKSNILPIYFEDLKQDCVRNVLKMAKFIDVPCSQEFAEEIADKCSFDKLKTNKIDRTAAIDKQGRSTLFRKGKVGDWKNWFTVAQNERFDAVYNEEMKDSILRYTFAA